MGVPEGHRYALYRSYLHFPVLSHFIIFIIINYWYRQLIRESGIHKRGDMSSPYGRASTGDKKYSPIPAKHSPPRPPSPAQFQVDLMLVSECRSS